MPTKIYLVYEGQWEDESILAVCLDKDVAEQIVAKLNPEGKSWMARIDEDRYLVESIDDLGAFTATLDQNGQLRKEMGVTWNDRHHVHESPMFGGARNARGRGKTAEAAIAAAKKMWGEQQQPKIIVCPGCGKHTPEVSFSHDRVVDTLKCDGCGHEFPVPDFARLGPKTDG